MRSLFILLLLMPLAWTPPAQAIQPDEILSNTGLETRARHISKDLRCVVCQNQSIDDSDAPLARDLRILVRERLVAGDSDQEVIDYVVSRYGDFVLLRPPVKGVTAVLWAGPLVFLLIGLIGIVVYFCQQSARAEGDEL
ncbi:MAG: cytochrome c-type biogenesis protein [Rhodospirillaceae bacterium]|jgi:cytochrome c-type biogenesis protein CcmH